MGPPDDKISTSDNHRGMVGTGFPFAQALPDRFLLMSDADPAPVRRYFDEIAADPPTRFGNITITPAEAEAFNREFDPIALGAPENGLSPWQLCAVMMRALCDDFLCQTACIASPGIDVKSFETPAFAGDRLYLTRQVLDARPSTSNPTIGRTKIQIDMFNQRGECVFTSVTNVLFHRRPAETPSEARS